MWLKNGTSFHPFQLILDPSCTAVLRSVGNRASTCSMANGQQAWVSHSPKMGSAARKGADIKNLKQGNKENGYLYNKMVSRANSAPKICLPSESTHRV